MKLSRSWRTKPASLSEVTRTGKDELRDRLLEVLDLAKEYYHFLLTKHDKGQTAHDYLKTAGQQ